jgi:hypothetical protein
MNGPNGTNGPAQAGVAGATGTGIAFGSIVSSVNAGSWELEVLATLASSGQVNWVGRGAMGNNEGTTPGTTLTQLVSSVAGTITTLSFGSAVTINCAGTTPTAVGDVSNTELLIEAVK